MADKLIRFSDPWPPGTPTIRTCMDTCSPASALPPYIDVSPYQSWTMESDYEPPTRKTRVPVRPVCPWCGVPSEDDKFHPGTCGECGGPR